MFVASVGYDNSSLWLPFGCCNGADLAVCRWLVLDAHFLINTYISVVCVFKWPYLDVNGC